MRVIEIKFASWDQSYYFLPKNEAGEQLNLKVDDQVVVKTQLGVDLGKVVGVGELYQLPDNLSEIKTVTRQATPEDELKILELNKSRKNLLADCRGLIKKLGLEMKLIDVRQSFDGLRLTYAFIADGRVDFRELVKDLAHQHQKSIRMHQIGVRDEAKAFGDFGACGRQLCCQLYLEDLGNVTTEMARDQQIAHRGAERLSGSCGRLKCCLRYEQSVYESAIKSLPSIGSKYKTKQGEGVVIGWHPLKRTVDVDLSTPEERKIIEVAIK